jgi:tetratricopeptide (TPR) repeat protein
LYIAGNLGFTLNLEGQYKEAEKVYRETLDADRRVFGPENPSTLLVLHSLAVVLTNEGQYDEAESLLRTSIDTMRRVLAPENPLRAVSLYSLGLVMALRGHKNEALSLLREAVDHGLSAASALGIEKNANLKSLHGDPRFAALVEHAKQLASLEQQSK